LVTIIYREPDTWINASRLGMTGAITETAVLTTTASHSRGPARVAFNADAREFQVAYGDGLLLEGRRLQHPTTAINIPYGTGCASGPHAVVATPPYAGSQFHAVQLTGRPNGTSCILLLSLASSAVPLDALGMTGCVLRASTDGGGFLASLGTTVSGGAAIVRMALPDFPLFQADLFAQWFWLQPGLNPAGLGASYGLRMQVR
jgi:hypothetical protein